MTRVLSLLVALSALLVAAGASAPGRCAPRSDMAYDLRKNHPAVHALWVRALPPSLRRDRVFSDFDGVSSDLSPLVVHGRPARLATACREHACTVDEVFAIISRRETRVVGMLRRVSRQGKIRLIYVGHPDATEARRLDLMGQQKRPRVCN